MGLPPFLNPVFTRAAGLLKAKPFPEAPTEETLYDLSDVLEDVVDASNLASAANTTASNAMSAAAAADAVADEALARATWDSFAFYGDELRYTVGTPASSVQPTFPYCWITFTTTNLASARFDVQMRPGTWTIKILTLKRNDCARLTVSLDGNVILNQLDLYSVAANLGYVHTLTGVVAGTDPVKDLVFLADGHNGASGSFVMSINKVWGYRTGA